jgi:hypothetical protein
VTALLDEIVGKLRTMPPEARQALQDEVARDAPVWFPSAGPQTQAFFCLADILLYGGQGGGGKTDLSLGLARTSHWRSLILRRQYANLSGLTDRLIQIHGSKDGYRGSPPPRLMTSEGRLVQFAGCQHAGDEQDWMGIPFDLKCFDETTQFLEQMVRLHIGWLRSERPGQRTRAILPTNPPLDAAGDWIIGMFRPWLDLTHHRPAKPGELRWYVADPKDGSDIEVHEDQLGPKDDQGRRPVKLAGHPEVLFAMSRTFIPAKLSDNPFLAKTDYQSRLDALPEPIRSAVRDGNFMAFRKDAANQVIPTRFVIEAQARWKPDGWKEFLMTAMAYDPAGGGRDDAVLGWRNGPWLSEMITEQGEHTKDGSESAALITQHRRNGAPVIVDAGGGAGHGFGGTTIMRLEDNKILVRPYNGASEASGKDKTRMFKFINKRAWAFWRLREALDPDQEGGSSIALPPDPELRADLCAPIFWITAQGIQVESKKEIRLRLGRSTGKGDVAVMLIAEGDAAVRRALNVSSSGKNGVLPAQSLNPGRSRYSRYGSRTSSSGQPRGWSRDGGEQG